VVEGKTKSKKEVMGGGRTYPTSKGAFTKKMMVIVWWQGVGKETLTAFSKLGEVAQESSCVGVGEALLRSKKTKLSLWTTNQRNHGGN